jgi:hypothetical protein
MRKSLELLQAQSKTPALVPQYKNLLRSKESRIFQQEKFRRVFEAEEILPRQSEFATIAYSRLESEWRCPGNLKRRKFPMNGLTPAARIAVYRAVGASGITSVAKIHAAEKTGDAVEAPSNFFLFFGSHTTHEHGE